MPDPAERFLTAATAPLADNAELQVMARRELEECLVDGEAEALNSAAERLEKANPPRGWKLGLYGVMVAVSIVSLGLLVRMVKSIEDFKMVISPLSGLGRVPNPANREAHLGKGLNAEQRLLLFGDTSKSKPADRFKALWDCEPGNPAYFAEFSLHFIQSNGSLPPDFLETAAKLDPDNAWFTVVAAGVTAKNSVKANRPASLSKEPGTAPGYTIVDPVRLDEAVKLLTKAAGQSRFESYQTSLMAKRIALLPRRTDLASHLSGWIHLGGFLSDSSHLMRAYEAADAAAWRAEDAGDSKAFLTIAEWWEPSLLRIIRADSPNFLMHALVARVALGGTARRYALTPFPDLENLYIEWEPVHYWIANEGEERSYREMDEKPRLRGGMVAGLILPVAAKQTREAPPITDADLKPGRMVDHELFARISAAVVWLLFGLLLLATALYRQRASMLVRRLSGRFEGLLKLADWAWILGAGVVLPFLFHLAIYRLTPLGARDWSIAASAFLVPAGQVAAMGFLMIVLPVLVARWRLGKRGPMLGWQKGRAWLGWTAVICGALSLPVFGLSFATGKGSEAVMMTAAALLGILVLTWLVIGIRAVFSKRPALLRRVTLSRILVPAYALGMLLMAASMPLYHAAEKRWLAQDRLMEITPEAPALSRYEWEVAQAMRAELLEILETK